MTVVDELDDPAAGGATPMPKANEPVARWPSTAETVRQATVYTPFGRFGLRGTASWTGLPGTGAVGPDVTGAPVVSRTLIVDRFGSGRSPKTIDTSLGDVVSVEPALGTLDWGRAWPRTIPGRVSVAASPRTAAMRITLRSMSAAWSGGWTPAAHGHRQGRQPNDHPGCADRTPDEQSIVGRALGARRCRARGIDGCVVHGARARCGCSA